MDIVTLLVTLVLGSYLFTAAGYAFTWHVYKLVTNHHAHRFEVVEKRLKELEKK